MALFSACEAWRSLEENLLPRLQEAQQLLAILDRDDYFNCTSYAPPVIKTGIRGRPKFFIPREQLEYFIEYGFNATDISKMLCVCDKTVYRRLEEYGISMRMNYTQITEPELDDVIRNILQEFPNSGYKSLRGHRWPNGDYGRTIVKIWWNAVSTEVRINVKYHRGINQCHIASDKIIEVRSNARKVRSSGMKVRSNGSTIEWKKGRI